MNLRYLLFAALLVGLAALGAGQSTVAHPSDPPAEKKASFTADVLPFLVKNCYACHGNGKTRGDLALDKFKTDEAVQRERKLWENVLHMVRAGEMPPKEKPRPEGKSTEAFLRSLDGL